jgi:uncharacterized protein YndB with AHSA1/START domain
MTVRSDATGAPARELVITRVFDAPRELVFKAFAEAERLAHWWGPVGFEIHVAKLEFRPGGVFHYRMAAPNGHQMWGQFYYREIVRPERIVWVNTFSDPDGGLTRAPFGPSLATFPLEVLNTVTLSEQDGKTTLSLRSYPINATDVERATFEGMLDSMQQGYGGTWDKLAAYLAKEQASA